MFTIKAGEHHVLSVVEKRIVVVPKDREWPTASVWTYDHKQRIVKYKSKVWTWDSLSGLVVLAPLESPVPLRQQFTWNKNQWWNVKERLPYGALHAAVPGLSRLSRSRLVVVAVSPEKHWTWTGPPPPPLVPPPTPFLLPRSLTSMSPPSPPLPPLPPPSPKNKEIEQPRKQEKTISYSKQSILQAIWVGTGCEYVLNHEANVVTFSGGPGWRYDEFHGTLIHQHNGEYLTHRPWTGEWFTLRSLSDKERELDDVVRWEWTSTGALCPWKQPDKPFSPVLWSFQVGWEETTHGFVFPSTDIQMWSMDKPLLRSLSPLFYIQNKAPRTEHHVETYQWPIWFWLHRVKQVWNHCASQGTAWVIVAVIGVVLLFFLFFLLWIRERRGIRWKNRNDLSKRVRIR